MEELHPFGEASLNLDQVLFWIATLREECVRQAARATERQEPVFTWMQMRLNWAADGLHDNDTEDGIGLTMPPQDAECRLLRALQREELLPIPGDEAREAHWYYRADIVPDPRLRALLRHREHRQWNRERILVHDEVAPRFVSEDVVRAFPGAMGEDQRDELLAEPEALTPDKPERIVRGRRGARPRYDWSRIQKKAMDILEYYGGISADDEELATQEALVTKLLEFCEVELGRAPVVSTMRARVPRWIEQYETTKRSPAS